MAKNIRTEVMTTLINRTSKAPVKTQRSFMMKHWNDPVAKLEKMAKDVKVVNKRIVF